MYSVDNLPKEAEFFQTPTHATKAMLKFIPKHVTKIWEPTAGGKAIAKVLSQNYDVICTDKYPIHSSIQTFDFIKDNKSEEEYDMIVLNPPYKKVNEFLEKLFLPHPISAARNAHESMVAFISLPLFETAIKSPFQSPFQSPLETALRFCFWKPV